MRTPALIKKLPLYGTVLLALIFSPLATSSAFALDNSGSGTDTCNPPANNLNGVHWPVGADAGTFTYQCTGTYAGFWTNAYYEFDPSTTVRTALYNPDYSFDCTTQTWSMTEWDYSPAQGAYVMSRVTPDSAPNVATGCPVVTKAAGVVDPNTSSSIVSSNSADPSSGGISNTGPGSTNATNGTITLNGSTTNNNILSLSNSVYSQAGTGNTFVVGNTTGGNATSGNAQSIANIANMLQSSSNAFGLGTPTFVANVNGDVNGDLMLDPSAILNTGPGSTNSANNNLVLNTSNANNTNAQINNNINVGANSGNATVANNTSGGNATSGNASAVVDLMNLINSTVAAGKSFVGVVNINGNLNGDILLPQGMIDQLLASSGPGSSNGLNTNVTDNSTTTNNTTEGIANNITSSANSGGANVANNTNAGSATTGSANTNVTLLNLTGSNTVGKDDLLVFVNVLGHWVGMIVNAPAGSTAASLGGGITSTGPGSQNGVNNNVTNNSQTTNNTTEGINNNVNVHAASGNASVTSNTSGGNATSGNANTAVNILNLASSNLSLSDWFGVLFINVFGNWTGSFGVNTSAGDPATTTPASTTDNSTGISASVANTNALKVFAFIPTTDNKLAITPIGSTGGGSSQQTQGSVLAATTVKGSSSKITTEVAHHNYFIPIAGIILAVLLLTGEKIRFFHRSTIR